MIDYIICFVSMFSKVLMLPSSQVTFKVIYIYLLFERLHHVKQKLFVDKSGITQRNLLAGRGVILRRRVISQEYGGADKWKCRSFHYLKKRYREKSIMIVEVLIKILALNSLRMKDTSFASFFMEVFVGFCSYC